MTQTLPTLPNRLENPTLRDALNTYCARVSILKKGYKQEKCRIELLCRSALADKSMREITTVHIADYRDTRLLTTNPHTQKPTSAATVRLELALLSHVFELSRIEWGYCEHNPVSNVRKPKLPPGRERRPTAREERRILRYAYHHINPEFYSIIVVAIETAMRQSEILNLRWENINLKTRIAHLPETKNGTKRNVPLSLRARDALTRLGAKTEGRVFHYTSDGLKSSWRYMNIRLGIEDLHFHDLRHHAISALFELGTLDMMEIATISGHKSLSMLKRYTHIRVNKIVRKLEGNKNKGKQVVIDHLIPYPAAVREQPGRIEVKLLDFDDIFGHGHTRETAIQSAQDALLRHIVSSLRDSRVIPPPDQYLESIREDILVMIDPLASMPQYA